MDISVKVLPYSGSVIEAVIASLPENAAKTDENVIAGNRFATYVWEDTLMHICEYPSRGEVRTVSCPLPAYSEMPAVQTNFSEKNPTALYQIELDNRRIDCGMSYILHLADGRFFMIDGGYFTYKERDRLYAMLRKIQPEGILKIAGWFFSHAHQDHMGCFLEFIARYANETEIEALYYTFPSLFLPESKYWSQSDNATIREFDYTVGRVLPHVKHCFLHTGQHFSLAGVQFEVLFTHEDIYPERIGTFNDTSTLLRMTYKGQTILFLGDLQANSCRKIEKTYGTYLKSDIVQVAHHGFNGSTIETYDLIAPTVALWPTPDYGYRGNCERQVNAHLIAMESVKEHLISGIHGTRKLTLPYIPGSSEAIDLPMEPLI